MVLHSPPTLKTFSNALPLLIRLLSARHIEPSIPPGHHTHTPNMRARTPPTPQPCSLALALGAAQVKAELPFNGSHQPRMKC
eukprot:scaffold6303_cov105-Isochrysis_galbana.AAC.3